MNKGVEGVLEEMLTVDSVVSNVARTDRCFGRCLRCAESLCGRSALGRIPVHRPVGWCIKLCERGAGWCFGQWQELGIAPVKLGIVRVEQNIAPQELGIAPMKLGIVPVEQGIAPEVQGIAPATQGIAPKVQGIAPEVQGIAPAKQGIAPKEMGNEVAPVADGKH